MRYWKRVDEGNNITTVESYSHGLHVEGAFEITESEYNAYLESLPGPDISGPSLADELASLKARVTALELKATSP